MGKRVTEYVSQQVQVSKKLSTDAKKRVSSNNSLSDPDHAQRRSVWFSRLPAFLVGPAPSVPLFEGNKKIAPLARFFAASPEDLQPETPIVVQSEKFSGIPETLI